MEEEDIKMILDIMKDGMNHSISRLQNELKKISTGKATTTMLDGLRVDYYGSPTPLSQVANLSTSDARTLVIQPWEKSMLAPIEKSIFEANLGVTPMNDGELVRIIIPPLTGDRRKSLVKNAKSLGEDAKVGIRQARKEAMDELKKAGKDGYPEDARKKKEEEVQKITNHYSNKVDEHIEAKAKDIMTV